MLFLVKKCWTIPMPIIHFIQLYNPFYNYKPQGIETCNVLEVNKHHVNKSSCHTEKA